MTDICTFPHWKLVAYADGSLHGAQWEITELHLRCCPQCRQWLAEMHEVDCLISTTWQPQHSDFLQARARLYERIAEAEQRTTGRWHSAVTTVFALLIVALMIQALVGFSPLVEGGSSFTSWFTRDHYQSRVYPEFAIPRPTPVSRPSFDTASDLPFGLVPDLGASAASGIPTAHAYYSANGLAILVGISERANSPITLPESGGDMLLTSVAEQEVLLFFAKTEVGRAIIEIDWLEGDTRVTILTLKQPPGGITVAMALELVSAFRNAPLSSP